MLVAEIAWEQVATHTVAVVASVTGALTASYFMFRHKLIDLRGRELELASKEAKARQENDAAKRRADAEDDNRVSERLQEILDSEREYAGKEIARLNAKIDAYALRVETLLGNLAELTGKYAELNMKYTAISDRYDRCEKEHQAVRDQNAKLVARLDAIESKVDP